MNLDTWDLNTLLIAAMKSEVDSRAMYLKLAGNIQNYLLKDKLIFLADEEEKHRTFIEDIYHTYYPDTLLKLPEKTPVPLPEVHIPDEETPLSNILQSAMEAEQAAHDFYSSLATRFIEDSQIEHTLQYFADMELQHYKILELEKQSMERFEQANIYWPMVHVGP